MAAYYNEIDAYAAQWLRNLIDAGHIAPGDVDERSIVDVRPDDLRGYEQCHFFAGIGGWSLALRLAGWPDDRPVWTGSCPCQPFSAAGAGKAADDERHLWPAWLPLIAECRPAIVFGEQVEAAIGWGWLDAVFADLEGEGYACGAAVLPACGVGAPHIRQRLWFVALADASSGGAGRDAGDAQCEAPASSGSRHQHRGAVSGQPIARGATRLLAHADGGHASAEGLQRGGQHRQQPQGSGAVFVGDASGSGLQERERDGRVQREALGPLARQAAIGGGDAGRLADAGHEHARRPAGAGEAQSGRSLGNATGRGAWRDLEWLPCTDGKARPVEPGTFPLAHGIPGRVGRLRAFGNAIVPQVAAEFIRAADR